MVLGINATRLYTLKYGQNKQVLSVGRVQTPTLSMVVNRHLDISNFKPQPYWELVTVYKNTKFSHNNGRFLNKESGQRIADKIGNQLFKIDDIVNKNARSPPKLFDLTGLQVYCNTKFGLTAEKPFKLRSHFMKKIITYPRVDSTYLSSDIYPKVKSILTRLVDYNELIQVLLQKP